MAEGLQPYGEERLLKVTMDVNEGALTVTAGTDSQGATTSTRAWAAQVIAQDFAVGDATGSTTNLIAEKAADNEQEVLGIFSNKPELNLGEEDPFTASAASPVLRHAAVIMFGLAILIVTIGTGSTAIIPSDSLNRHATEDQTWIDAGTVGTNNTYALSIGTAGSTCALLVMWNGDLSAY